MQQKYKDATYTGTGTGFRGGTTKISITIKDGQISDMSTISSQDTPDFYQRAENVITDEIISAQSTSVDTVSGATYSSKGIISAVKDALTQAEAGAAAY
ncbi:MAG: FMN-binding protein [Clostridiaceae bacterium]